MKLFNSLPPQVVFQEVPNEVSLQFTITGCQIGCVGCHSTDIWDASEGIPLTNNSYTNYLEKYHRLITCVLFLGGEWNRQDLIDKLKIAKHYNLKTCLFTGLNTIHPDISLHLDYLKTGKWIAENGGLDNPSSNQTFMDLNMNIKLNHHFWRKDTHDKTDQVPNKQQETIHLRLL